MTSCIQSRSSNYQVSIQQVFEHRLKDNGAMNHYQCFKICGVYPFDPNTELDRDPCVQSPVKEAS